MFLKKHTNKKVKKGKDRMEKMLLNKSTKDSYPKYLMSNLKSFLKKSKKLEQAFYRRGYPEGQ